MECYVPWQYFGSSHPSTAASFIADFTKTKTGCTDTNSIKAKIDDVISKFIRASYEDDPRDKERKEFLWVHIRISFPNARFDVPRWHQDGPYMKLDLGTEHEVRNKYCLTILGPGTMFKEQTSELEQYVATASFRGERSQVANEMEKFKSYNSSAGEVVRCTWKRTNDDYASNVHSEPPHDEQRIFLAAVFMSEEEREELLAGRK
ncbi:hypothetical protein DPSP01_014402 [Paraphaeosphaeria sporulosa]